MKTSSVIIFLSILPLYACSYLSSHLDERTSRIGLSRQQLISELGPPKVELHTTQLGGPSTTALVYDDHPVGHDCLDAYVVDSRSGTVIDYHCH